MAPTAAMLILGRHTRPMSQALASEPIFLVKLSLAKWVSYCSSIFETRAKEKESIVDLYHSTSELGKKGSRKKLPKSAVVDDQTVE